MIEKGTVLDGIYRIDREIGQGGTGVVYLAEHLRLHKRVVVKKIKDHFAGQVNGRAEVDILKNLRHACLPQVYDFLMIGNSVYTVMDFIEGRDLQYYLDQNYIFSEETVRKWLLQLAGVLEYLHTRRPPILHSDIKPANIMITDTEDVCLIDFNISLDGETTKDVQGISPWYAAPEQYERAQHVMQGQEDRIILDGRMDIYSLGATFYRVMTGYLPSPTEDQSAALEYMNIPYSGGLKAIVSRMLKCAPSRRFASAGKLREALEDMSKMDPVCRRLGYIQMGAAVGWLLCVAAGILCIYYGSWRNTVEKWQQAYQELYQAVQREDDAAVISEGTRLLNSLTYQGYLDKNEGKKAEVLNMLGESCFRQEQYRDAAGFYKEAWELEEEESRYCENYVIALIRDGQIERAEQATGSQEGELVLSPEKQNLISQELAWMSGETKGARKELERLSRSLTDTGDAAAIIDAYLLLADIFTRNGEYPDAVAVLEDALQISGEKDVRRQLGETAYLASQSSEREVNRHAYLGKALENYKVLNQSSHPSYEDGLNLALVERALGKYENSNATLKNMLAAYPDEYVLPMWMCYNYLDLAKERGGLQSVRDELRFRYQDSKHIYESGTGEDADMEQLKEIMEHMGE